MKEALKLSIEQCLMTHIAKGQDAESTSKAAAEEIIEAICRPLVQESAPRGTILVEALELIERIDHTLRVPAAEYVPAIGDVFALIDEFKKRH